MSFHRCEHYMYQKTVCKWNMTTVLESSSEDAVNELSLGSQCAVRSLFSAVFNSVNTSHCIYFNAKVKGTCVCVWFCVRVCVCVCMHVCAWFRFRPGPLLRAG